MRVWEFVKRAWSKPEMKVDEWSKGELNACNWNSKGLNGIFTHRPLICVSYPYKVNDLIIIKKYTSYEMVSNDYFYYFYFFYSLITCEIYMCETHI